MVLLLFQRHLDQFDSVLRSFGLPSLYPGIFFTQPIDDLVSLHTKLFALDCERGKLQN